MADLEDVNGSATKSELAGKPRLVYQKSLEVDRKFCVGKKHIGFQ
jgi:hypothetical protein